MKTDTSAPCRLHAAALIALASIAAVLMVLPLRAQDRPNILILLADDLQADAIGAYGNPYIDTPQIDRLVGDGFNFHRAYNLGSHHGAVCAPSRAMMMSGRSLYRVYDDLDSVATYPELLREAGYRTFGTGKWHQSRASFAKSFSAGKAVFFGGMSDHFNIPIQDLRTDGGFTETVVESYSTDLFADAAVDFLARYESDDPFLAYVSFTVPHDPRTPPDEFLSRYEADGMPLPPNYLPAHPFNLGPMGIRDEVLADWPRMPDVIRSQLAEYYGLITHMDREIGRILEAAERHENTIIIFASDHGLAMGRHGLLGKQNLYEHSVRAPLIVAGPDIPHGDSRALVYLHDLFPTILSLAGVPRPADAPDGTSAVAARDLSAVWNAPRTQWPSGPPEWRGHLFLTYEDVQRAVVEDCWKLIRYPKIHHTQLFNICDDPYELRDRFGEPAHASRQAALYKDLVRLQSEAADPHPLTAAERIPMDVDYDSIERTPDRHQPNSVVEKYFD